MECLLGAFFLKKNYRDAKMFAFITLRGISSWFGTWAPSQYQKRRLFVRSRKVSKPRYWYFKLWYRFEIWQAHRQHCCRSACQISERSDNSKYKSRGFETLRDLTERRLFGYWDGAQWTWPNSFRVALTHWGRMTHMCVSKLTQWTHGVLIMSLLRQNDVVMSFWRNNDAAIIASCVRWESSLVRRMACRLFGAKP